MCQSVIMATQFRTEDALCKLTICRSPLPVGTHRRLLKPPLPSNESASRFLPVRVRPPLWRESVCMQPCFAKLDKSCKSIHAIQKTVSDLSLLAACSREVTTAFPYVKNLHNQCNRAQEVASEVVATTQRSLINSKAETGKQSYTFAHCSLCVLCNNLQYCDLIGPYHIPVMGPRNLTWFTFRSSDHFPRGRCGLGTRLFKHQQCSCSGRHSGIVVRNANFAISKHTVQ